MLVLLGELITGFNILNLFFQIHRTLNFLAVILMIASIIFIVWNKGSWTGPWFGMSSIGAKEWHSLVK